MTENSFAELALSCTGTPVQQSGKVHRCYLLPREGNLHRTWRPLLQQSCCYSRVELLQQGTLSASPCLAATIGTAEGDAVVAATIGTFDAYLPRSAGPQPRKENQGGRGKSWGLQLRSLQS